MSKLRDWAKQHDLHIHILNTAMNEDNLYWMKDDDEYSEEFIEFKGESKVINIDNVLKDFKVISNTREYIDWDPYNVRIVSFQDEIYRICTYHDSYGGGERPCIEDIKKGKMVPKTIEVFEEDEQA